MNYSPLRYPGGKAKIAPLVELLINKSHIQNPIYVEPFAGGAGVALALLMNNSVEEIVINDYDKAIYSIWRAIKEDTQDFINLIRNTPITVTEWHRQKDVYDNQNKHYSLELAFATFFLNRTNRSGILNAGPIGGYDQTGNYLIDARFNREELMQRIENIARQKSRIHIYNKDIRSYLRSYMPVGNNIFAYLDPPYYNKGQALYKNFFCDTDHKEISDMVKLLQCYWMVTYDAEDKIRDLYRTYPCKMFSLSYSAATKILASEIMILSDENLWPAEEELKRNKIKINLREDR
ncbi:DNA adenine methylase [Caproiciproducens sp.]|uniref:DNA adenine methylase n=1 Tax=Caproiciproducens sp. TaxID=1954376 RepID=UPI00289C2B7B|nr:DNA adenine methylase [Caproiciproducens sp.]